MALLEALELLNQHQQLFVLPVHRSQVALRQLPFDYSADGGEGCFPEMAFRGDAVLVPDQLLGLAAEGRLWAVVCVAEHYGRALGYGAGWGAVGDHFQSRALK